MKTSVPLTVARYLGIGLAVCVPALVVAQQIPTFAPNQVLLAEQLQRLATVLSTTRSRVDALEANAGAALTKANIYESPADSGPMAQNADGIAIASCEDANDIMLGCSCQGLQGGSNSLQIDLRRVTASNPRGAASSCICQGVNVGTNEVRTIRAIAQCLPIP